MPTCREDVCLPQGINKHTLSVLLPEITTLIVLTWSHGWLNCNVYQRLLVKMVDVDGLCLDCLPYFITEVRREDMQLVW